MAAFILVRRKKQRKADEEALGAVAGLPEKVDTFQYASDGNGSGGGPTPVHDLRLATSPPTDAGYATMNTDASYNAAPSAGAGMGAAAGVAAVGAAAAAGAYGRMTDEQVQ